MRAVLATVARKQVVNNFFNCSVLLTPGEFAGATGKHAKQSSPQFKQPDIADSFGPICGQSQNGCFSIPGQQDSRLNLPAASFNGTSTYVRARSLARSRMRARPVETRGP